MLFCGWGGLRAVWTNNNFLPLTEAAINYSEFKLYKSQLNQLMDKKMTFEVQLLKLKRERKMLTERGAKHEDVMMKENAGMQVSGEAVYAIWQNLAS